MRKWFIIILFTLFPLLAHSQTDSLRLGFVVRGQVVDAQSGKPLEAVHVSLPDRHHATVTNADGEFILKSDREIKLVICSYLGYKTRRIMAGGKMHITLVRAPTSSPASP